MSIHLKTNHHQNNCVLTISNANDNDDNKDNITIALQLLGDVSGSMGDLVNIQQSKLDICQQTTNFIIDNIAHHHFGFISFDSDAIQQLPLETIKNRQVAKTKINKLYPGTSTNISKPLSMAFSNMSNLSNFVKYIILLTDGIPNNGITDPDQLVKLVQQNIDKDTNLAIIGVGNDCDHNLLSKLSNIDNGNYYFIDNPEKIPQVFGEIFGTALETRQQGLTITFNKDILEPIDSINYKVTDNTITIGDLLNQETKHIGFHIKNIDAYKDTSFTLNYLQCAEALLKREKIDCKQSTENKPLIRDTLDVFKLSQLALEMETMSPDIKDARIDQFLANVQGTSQISDSLRKTATQMKGLHQPQMYRRFSEDTGRQRGGEYSNDTVKQWRSKSVHAVEQAKNTNNSQSRPITIPTQNSHHAHPNNKQHTSLFGMGMQGPVLRRTPTQ